MTGHDLPYTYSHGQTLHWAALIPLATADLSEPMPDLPDGVVLDLEDMTDRFALELATALRSPRAIAAFDTTGDYIHPWPAYLDERGGLRPYILVTQVLQARGWGFGQSSGSKLYISRPKSARQ